MFFEQMYPSEYNNLVLLDMSRLYGLFGRNRCDVFIMIWKVRGSITEKASRWLLPVLSDCTDIQEESIMLEHTYMSASLHRNQA